MADDAKGRSMIASASTNTAISARTGVLPALLAIALGLFFVYGVGFAVPSAIHNAAHDTRHTLAFPCH
jgi:cobalt transporter subunit CbtB